MTTVTEMTTRIRQDPSLREALEAAAGQDGRIAAFRAAGLDVSPQDLTDAEAAAEQDELSETDLEGVAGGVYLALSSPSIFLDDRNALFRTGGLTWVSRERPRSGLVTRRNPLRRP